MIRFFVNISSCLKKENHTRIMINPFSRKKKPKYQEKNSNNPEASLSLHKSTPADLAERIQDPSDLRQVFDRFDTNGDGRISASELGAMLRSLGSMGTAEEVASMMKVADVDGDGYISLEEFMLVNSTSASSSGKMRSCVEDLREAFTIFDRDGNGLISAKELHQVLKGMGDKATFNECKEMIKKVDKNGDGAVNFEEFLQMMTRS